jgi:hypothetical protein
MILKVLEIYWKILRFIGSLKAYNPNAWLFLGYQLLNRLKMLIFWGVDLHGSYQPSSTISATEEFSPTEQTGSLRAIAVPLIIPL